MKIKEKKVNISKFHVFILMVILLVPAVVFAWTYTIALLSWDLVDSGKHLDWSGSTKYSSEFSTAINKWNTYKSGIIRKDTIWTINDMTVSDVAYLGSGVIATTSSNGSLKFATDYMDNHGYNTRLSTCMHELGHALRLAHRTDTGSIMYPYLSSVTTLSDGDKANYDAAYLEY